MRFATGTGNPEMMARGDRSGLRGYAGVDPVLEWKKEAARLWHETLRLIRSRAVTLWFLVAAQGIGVDTDVRVADDLGP